jgi:hypothetical protein
MRLVYLRVVHVMFPLFCHVLGRFDKNDFSRTKTNVTWGLIKCVDHQDDMMLSSWSVDDLNSGFRS